MRYRAMERISMILLYQYIQHQNTVCKLVILFLIRHRMAFSRGLLGIYKEKAIKTLWTWRWRRLLLVHGFSRFLKMRSRIVMICFFQSNISGIAQNYISMTFRLPMIFTAGYRGTLVSSAGRLVSLVRRYVLKSSRSKQAMIFTWKNGQPSNQAREKSASF